MPRHLSAKAKRVRDRQLEAHAITTQLRDDGFCNIVVLAGAGISVSAGIPDFRSPGTGLYDNLQKFNLPEPEAVFTLDYFRKNPRPFTLLAKELWPSHFCPTLAHFFVRLLEVKQLLRRHYTQNIDGLDAAVGITDDRLVEAHGTFTKGHCINCCRQFTEKYLRERILKGKVARCQCGGLVKPNIVFFGEELPRRFTTCSQKDFENCDLLICMGTSLQVEPFASLVSNAPQAKRILINLEEPDAFHRSDADLILLGDCDTQIWRLANALGWCDELEYLAQSHHAGSISPTPKLDNQKSHATSVSEHVAAQCINWQEPFRWRGVVLLLMVLCFGCAVARQHFMDGNDASVLVGVALWACFVGAIATQTL